MKQMLKGETSTYVFVESTKVHIQSTVCFQQLLSPLLVLAYLSIPDTVWKNVGVANRLGLAPTSASSTVLSTNKSAIWAVSVLGMNQLIPSHPTQLLF